MSKFKVGDRVRYKESAFLSGQEEVVKGLDPFGPNTVLFEGGGWDSSRLLKLVEPAPVYEEGWTLNDGKVEIPDDAKTLKEGDDVVAFKRRIKPSVSYINVYKNTLGHLYPHDRLVRTREEADTLADEDSDYFTRVACVKVTEGQYDD